MKLDGIHKLFSAEKAIIGAVVTIASVIAIAFGIYFHFEGKFIEATTAAQAHQQMQETIQTTGSQLQEQIELTGRRLDAKILEDRISRIQERIWRYVEKYGPECGQHKTVCEQWKADIKRLERQLPGGTGR